MKFPVSDETAESKFTESTRSHPPDSEVILLLGNGNYVHYLDNVNLKSLHVFLSGHPFYVAPKMRVCVCMCVCVYVCVYVCVCMCVCVCTSL